MPFQMRLDTHHPQPERALEEFSVDRPGTILSLGHHMATSQQVRCLIRTISLSGAVLEVNAGIEVPTHFFLEILGIHDEIGCTLLSREATVATVSFNMLINPEFLHHVLRLGFDADA